jgi:hypothetical protein
MLEPKDARRWFKPRQKAAKALIWLDQEGLVFPVGQGRYAVPAGGELALALGGKDALERLATWLPGWLREHQDSLPSGLRWGDATFIELLLREETDLVWKGPRLLVPISKGVEHLGRLHNRLPVMALDCVYPGQKCELGTGKTALMPYKRELVRVLSVHNDPRLQEAAAGIELSEKTLNEVRPLIPRTDPPMPFPDPKVRLPQGPPFRYRIYAPLSWVRRNLEFSHPSRGKPKGGG